MSRGSIIKRGQNSWRLKLEGPRDPGSGERATVFKTVRGSKKDAQLEITRMLAAIDAGTFVQPSKLSVADYVRGWIKTAETLSLAAKTAERYRQLIEGQIVPRLGKIPLQRLTAAHIAGWHADLLAGGGQEGRALSARTVGHAHRVLHKALTDATKREVMSRNPAALVSPPRVAVDEMQILCEGDIALVLSTMKDTPIYAQVVVLLSTGLRRGELLGLRWGDLDLGARALQVERAVEKTKATGLRLKAPKTKHGRRRISLPQAAIEALREHRKQLLELRLVLGLGKLQDSTPVFCTPEGNLADPDKLSKDWNRLAAARGLPKVNLHALRHSHASALIAAGLDVVTVSRRLGHANPSITMNIYAHLFHRGDETAADAIDTLFAKR
jgi:integrase